MIGDSALNAWFLAESQDCTKIVQPAGANVQNTNSSDVSPRSKYGIFVANGSPLCRVISVPDSPTGRAIAPADALISMENVLYANDACILQNFCADWSTQNQASFISFTQTFQDTHDPFSAQTVVASSYGLHQLLYSTAVGMGYRQNEIGLPAHLLFDPFTSLDLGSRYLATVYLKAGSAEQLDFSDEKQFLFQFGPALSRFNGGAVNFSQIFNRCSQGSFVLDPNDARDRAFAYPCQILHNTPDFVPSALGGNQ